MLIKLLTIVAVAACVQSEEILPGHSSHGESFNEGPRQAAYLMDGTGNVHFSVTTGSAEVQKFIDQGVGQLHGFWYFEAERSFRQAATIDPNCAIAYWGMAVANRENEKRARGFIARAADLKTGASAREQMWIDAFDAYLKEGAKDKERRAAYVEALSAISKQYPDDLEAKAMLAVQIWMNSSKGIKIDDHEKVDALLKEVLARNPEHPCHHYRIHLWDKKEASRALDAAAKCGPASPGIAHMWHMPGHIYSKLHRYQDAAWQQEASARVDHSHMMRDRVLPDQIHNFAHNNEWLIRNLSHVGRVADALSLAKNMIELPRHPKYNHPGKKNSSCSYGRRRLIELLVRFEMWDTLVALADGPHLPPSETKSEKILTAASLGLAWQQLNQFQAAAKEVAKLQGIRDELKSKQEAAAKTADEKAIKEKKKPAEIKKLVNKAKNPFNGDLNAAASAIAELNGWAALNEGNLKSAADYFGKAKQASKVRLALASLRTGDVDKAVKLAKEAVDKAKGQIQPMASYVDVLYRAKKFEDAYRAFYDLRRLAHSADRELPVLLRLRPIAKELGMNSEWMLPREIPDDLGDRPPLDDLGPFRWQPVVAPSWTLPGLDNSTLSSRMYRGRPMLLIFYLGYRCRHCYEQLEAIVPVTEDFAASGISIVGISTDPVESLAGVHRMVQKGEEFPFPLAADPAMEVFKSFRSFDDFEQMPLHGTFLIDADGFVRWQDISFEPFMDAKFLLKESQRLLSQPATRKRRFK